MDKLTMTKSIVNSQIQELDNGNENNSVHNSQVSSSSLRNCDFKKLNRITMMTASMLSTKMDFQTLENKSSTLFSK